MKPTRTIKYTICRWHSFGRIEDTLQWINVSEVEVEIKICLCMHNGSDVQAFIEACILLLDLHNITCKVTKLDVTQMAKPELTIDFVKRHFSDSLRQIILNIGGREVKHHI